MTSQRLTADARAIGHGDLLGGAARALLFGLLLLGQQMQARAAPRLVSIFPLGGQRGTTLEVEFQGTGLEGADAVWLGPGSQLEPMKVASTSKPTNRTTKGPDGLEARVTTIPDGSRAKVRLVISAEARVGFHSLNLISPSGVSGNILFWVGPPAVIQEMTTPHHSPETAQQISVPVAVSGRIERSGQLAYYAFEIGREQTVAFEIVSQQGADFNPQLALYEAGGSYLDPRRSKRLLFREEVTQGGLPADRRMTYHFTKPGRYLLNLANAFAQGGGGASYLLRIAPDEPLAGAEDALSWGRRRLREIGSRSVGAPATEVGSVKDAESNDRGASAQACAVPAVLEGTIGRPGDTDYFAFKATAGQKVALELRTPRAASPHFNVRLDVLDAKGAVVLSNLQAHDAKVGTVDAKVVQFVPLLSGTLAEAGEYRLRVRSLTSIRGSGDHVYQVLARPQIPHVGEVQLQPDGPVNLLPGARQRLTVGLPAQEGYSGGAALSVEGLPPGVRAFVGANSSLIEFLAEASAPRTPLPQIVRISGLPLAGGKSGSAFPVAEVPLMVIGK